jgi:hypothetical protein
MSAKTTKPDPSEWMRMLTGSRLQLTLLALAILVELAGQVVQ